MIIGCFEETTISGALITPTYDATVLEFTDDGAVFKIYLERYDEQDSSTEYASYPLDQVFSWTTDINLCYESQVSLVSDEIGETLSTSTTIVLGDNPTLKDAVSGLVYPILLIDRKTPTYSAIFVRGQTHSSAVFDVLKGFVTVCGNEQITTDDSSNSVFDISLIGNLISE